MIKNALISCRILKRLLLVLLLVFFGFSIASGWQPVPVKEDPLVRMPGTQPVPENAPDIEDPTRCTNCHGGFNQNVEPAFNWQGSMMAQSARDFLFYACLTTAAQDAIWAVGNPNATDICERCHFPQGWVEGRSDPTNASLMTGSDFDGVHCDVCHSMYDPFFETTFAGTREGSDWLGYWDETNASDTPSLLAAEQTYQEDGRLAGTINYFSDGLFDQLFFSNNLPPANYTENASGQFFLDDVRDKRASFADANARHPMLYSRYHKSKYMCSTCHDVSNPILANLNDDPAAGHLTSELNSAFSYYHVERTFSEFMLSDYGQQGGSSGIGPFAPDVYTTSRPGNVIAACQDCHMRDGVGKAASQNDALVRPTDSVEHPQSGQPIHDLTGGNAWVSTVLASAVGGSPNYDATNDALLNQGADILTLDLGQGLGIDPVALLAGADRAMEQLRLAASINNVTYDAGTGSLSFQVQNQTGHKLISGFPEGRRMFINIKATYPDGSTYEVNPYDYLAGTLKGLSETTYDGQGALPDPAGLAGNEVYLDELVYEMKPTSALTGEKTTFHFALATGRYKDNRIPPKGFQINAAAARISVPVSGGAEVPGLYTAEEYAGGYDQVTLTLPAGASQVDVNLYYQTTSREYIEFLRDEINGYVNTTNNPTLTGTGAGGDAPYIIQTAASNGFFDNLKAWGDTIWQLWTHNMNVTTAAPYLMYQSIIESELVDSSSHIGIVRGNTYYLKATNASGVADLVFSYGNSTDTFLVGDWDGDGVSTPGIKRGNSYYLRNSNSSGVADVTFSYGSSTDTPIVGDWDGNGTDTIGIKRGNSYYLRNSNSSGVADVTFSYGLSTDTPIVGDWDGNDADTIGIKRNNSYYLRNSNSIGVADVTFSYGSSTDMPIVGDWDGDGTDTIGIKRGSSFYLRNSNSSGVADLEFSYGSSTDIPVIGEWGISPP